MCARWATRHPRPPESVTNCRVGCQRAAPHFDDDSVWRGAFDPFPSFVNKEYTLIDAAHIMAVWELAGRKRHVCHIERPPLPSPPLFSSLYLSLILLLRAKLEESTFELLSTSNPLYNGYYGSLPCTAAIHPLSSAACLISVAFDQHPRLFKSTDSPNTNWVSYSYVLKWTSGAYHIHNVTWQSRVRISLNQP